MYYARCTAFDRCMGDLLRTVKEEGIGEETVFLFFSDHGDMLGSHGKVKKQQPWEESDPRSRPAVLPTDVRSRRRLHRARVVRHRNS